MSRPIDEGLGPRARALVEAGRHGADPSDADRARIKQVLALHLAASPSADPGAVDGAATDSSSAVDPAALDSPMDPSLVPPAPLAATGVGWAPGLAVAAGAGLIAVLGYLGLSSEPTRPAPAPPVLVPAAPRPEGAPAELEPKAEASPEAATPGESPTEQMGQGATDEAPKRGESEPRPAKPRSNASGPLVGNLAEEVEILSRATAALHSGRPAEALRLLAEHQRDFPKGALSLERRIARAHALCLLGRHSEAEAELARLPQSSPQVARVRQLCVSP